MKKIFFRIGVLNIIFFTTIMMGLPYENINETTAYISCAASDISMIKNVSRLSDKKVGKVIKKSNRKETHLTKKEIKLIALVTMAEAESENEKGKRLVIDTVLNRVDSKNFPNTVQSVIYQKNQFSSMWNGRASRCHAQKKICKLVKEEARKRLNKKVVFFTAGKYGKYGTPMFRVGNHYFSSYK